MIPLARVLAKQNTVFAPDLPGHGRSPGPARVLNIRELASALRGWLDTARIERAVFAGNSMGAQVLVELADMAPERIEAAVLLGPTMDQTRSTPLAHVWRLFATSCSNRRRSFRFRPATTLWKDR